jgi:hypothetical protein
VPLPTAGEVNRPAGLHRQRGYAGHLIAIRDAAVTDAHASIGHALNEESPIVFAVSRSIRGCVLTDLGAFSSVSRCEWPPPKRFDIGQSVPTISSDRYRQSNPPRPEQELLLQLLRSCVQFVAGRGLHVFSSCLNLLHFGFIFIGEVIADHAQGILGRQTPAQRSMRVRVRGKLIGEPRLTDGFADGVVQVCKGTSMAAAHVAIPLYREDIRRQFHRM